MKLYDVTVPVFEGMPVWPKDPGVSLPLARSIARGDYANVTRIEMGAHTGTHMDAPFHFEPNGCGIDQLPLDVLVGPCRVFDLTIIPGHIDRAALAQCDLRGVTRALFKTRNSQRWARGERAFDSNFIAVATDGAAELVARGVKLVGVDYLSVEPFGSKEHPVHHALLRANVVVIEGLNLYDVPAGDYELIALPLKLSGADGAPARVILRAR
jgi:arylformamidase